MKLTGKKIKSMFLCMMLVAAMAFTVVGCGNKTEGTEKNTETAIVNTESTVETEAVAETESVDAAMAQEIILGEGSVKFTLSWWMQMETRQTLWSAQIKKQSATLC